MSSGRLIASAPVLLVADVVSAANHYRDAMGFGYDRFWGEPPGFVILRRDGMTMMLKQARDPADITPLSRLVDLWNAYFWVENVESLHAEFVARGAVIAYAPCDQPYGCRDFAIRDRDGYEIGFGERVA